MTLAVTGATGELGGRVARRLVDKGIVPRLVVREPSRAPKLPGVTVAQASYGEAEAAQRALDGVDTVFMVSAAESPDRVDEHRTFVDAAAAAGVGHIVYTSFLGAAPDATFILARDHWATEEHIKQSGMSWTVLRDGPYLDFIPLMVGADDVIRGPAGDGKASAVARGDIADAAVAVLLNPKTHVGKTYNLTGSQALGFSEIAETLSAVTGRTISYHSETIDEAYQSRSSYGAPDWMVDGWVSTYTAIAKGELALISSDVERLTGHLPITLQQLLTEER